jgi:hypothetical protein
VPAMTTNALPFATAFSNESFRKPPSKRSARQTFSYAAQNAADKAMQSLIWRWRNRRRGDGGLLGSRLLLSLESLRCGGS